MTSKSDPVKSDQNNSGGENPLYLNSKKSFKPTKSEDYGSFFYSDRNGSEEKTHWYDKFISYGASREVLKKNLCEQNVQNCIENHPGVKLLLSAMKSAGCEANLLRHFSCEKCDTAIKGGFDPSTNQSIICYNTVNSHKSGDVAQEIMSTLLEAYDYCRANFNTFDLRHLACTKVFLCHNRTYEYKDVAEILSHELVHAFDYCRANIDIENNYQVACSEIRAANLTSCRIFDAVKNDAALFSIKDAQKECVRRKAALSLQMVRNVSELEAYRVVDEVFDKCYNDLEPFGRRVLNEKDCERAYKDRKSFGYD